MVENAQPQAQPERDDREHRALVMVLRALLHVKRYIADESDNAEIEPALTIAGFIWPEAYAEATRDEEGGG